MTAENPKLQGPDGEYLDLRDYFAAAALTGLMANSPALEGAAIGAKNVGVKMETAAALLAYNQADAMLKERNT